MVNRSIQPGYSLPSGIEIPSPQKLPLSDGREVLWLPIGTQDIVRITLQFPAGTKYQHKPLQASSTLGLMSEGTIRFSAQEIAEKLDFYGSHIDYSIDRDHSSISAFCLKRYVLETLDVLRDIVLAPKYDENEFETYRQKRKNNLDIEKRKVMYVAREQFVAALYGAKNAYGSYAESGDYDNLCVEDFQQYHDDRYLKSGALLFVSGMVDQDLVQTIAAELSAVVRSNTEDQPTVDLNQLPEPAHIYIPKDDAVQSAIRIGRVMFDRSHSDYSGMSVLTTILGGYFGSRLMANIREDKGYTYGIFSSLVNLQESGYLTVGTEVGCQVTQPTLEEIYKEMELLRSEKVDVEELSLVVNYLSGEMLRMLDGPFSVVDAILDLYQSNLPIDFIAEHYQRIKSITPDDLQALAQKYLNPEDFTEVVVGKR